MKYWAYVNNEILGPFEKDKLLELPTFSPSLLVCPQTPVGEKTEDWKEASSYPELSALAGGAMHSAAMPAPQPAPAPAPAPEPAAQAFPQPAIEPVSLSFKPLTAAQSVEPMAPPTHTDGMANITVNKLGKSGIASSAPAEQPAAVAQASSGFDPISLSTIIRRSENLSGQDAPAPAPAPEGLALEPRTAQPAPAPAPSIAEPPAFTPEPAAPAPQPAIPQVIEREDFPSAAPAQAPAAAAGSFDTAGLQKLIQRLDDLSKVSATRKDIDSALDPVRFKLDQMGEVISSIKNSQFQREVMDKLSYLENAVGELKATLRGGAPAPAPSRPQEVKFESNSDTVFGVQQAPAPKAAEKPAPAKEAAPPQEVKDQGTKKSNVGAALKKVFKLLITLVLLAAVLLGTVIGLKNFGVFDATKFLPFPLPFLGGAQSAAPQPQAADPFSGEQSAAQAQPEQPGQSAAGEAASPTPEQQEALRKAMQEQAQAMQDKKTAPVPPEAVPEVIYITRTYKAAPAGQSLENKIYEHAGKSGGNYNKTNWSVRSADGGKFEIDALIPAKTSMLTYTFLVDREKKGVQPLNEPAKAAFDALTAPPARAARAPKKAAAKPAPAPKKKAAPKAAAPADEEYEYVYEDETE